ncbi:centromere protein T isoform X3 [Heptranchias perlo]|uniref:centromere protein T isoform X3 n=1 Tax=Heptranchias perlo TaxID=212740 RepID=UPI00355A4908
MDSLPEDVTMRTLIKGMIAEEVPQSIVRPRTHSRLQKRTSTPKKITNISVHQSPSMVLHSKLKTEVARSLRKQIAGTAGSSKRHSIRRNSPALRKTKTAEPIPLEALDDYTPRGLLKKFIQTEPESSLVKVVNPKMKESAQKKSQPKTKLSSGSNDSFSLSLPAEDTTEQKLPIDRNLRKRKKISVSEFEKATQQRLQHTAEPQESEQVELYEKSTKLPDVSTIVGLINPDFEESTTKPILSRRPVKRKVINEDDFEEGVHNYLEQEKKEPEEIVRSGPFEKTAGLTDISGLVGSINVDTEESVSKPVLSRRQRRDKLISEDDFEEGVLFYLRQTKDVQTQQGAREHQSEHGGSETAAIAQHSEKNKPDEEKETENDGDYQADYEELEMPKDTDQNLSTQGGQNPSAAPHSEGTDIDGGVLVDEMGGKRVAGEEVNEARVDDGVLVVEVSEARVEGDDVNDRMEGDDVNDRMEGDDVNDRMEGDDVNDRMEGDDVNDRMEGDDVNDRMEGDDVNDGMEGDDVNDGMEGDDVNDGVLVDEVSETRVEGDEGMEFDEKTEGDEVDDERVEGDGVEDEEVEPNEVDEREESIDDSEDDSKVRPTFQQSDKVFRSSPLLTTPHFLKILARKAQKPLAKVKQNPKKPIQKQKKTILPSSFVKSVFSHYAKMKVKKEAFTAVEKCLELYFKQLCEDVDVYSKHAKRKTIEKEDLELLMKRQGFVTAKTPLNVLIEHHLPMECREKLIPMAVSGSKIIPKK